MTGAFHEGYFGRKNNRLYGRDVKYGVSQEFGFPLGEGLDLHGYLALPTNWESKRLRYAPFVVMLHGYGSSGEGFTGKFYKLAERLLFDNVGSLWFDFRSPRGHEIPTFPESDASFLGLTGFDSDEAERTVTNMLFDTETALNIVRDYGATRIGLLGNSLGSWPALFTAARLGKEYDISAVATWAGASKYYPERFRDNDPGREVLMEDIRKYDVSEFGRLKEMGIPHLIIHGGRDKIISPEEDPHELAKLTNGEVKIYKSENHRLNEKHTRHIIEQTRKFFVENL